MSEEPVIEKRKIRPNRIGLRKLGALAGIAFTAPGTVAHNLMHPAPAEAATPLTTIEQLPGYGKKVGPEVRRALHDSSVVIIRQSKGYEYLGKDDICNGFLLNNHGETEVVTAGHCLPPESNSFSWSIENPISTQPLAKVISWRLSKNGDTAFMKLNPKSETSDFKKLKPLNSSMLTEKPELGQQVASRGFDFKTKKYKEWNGTLLGKIIQQGHMMYVVGAQSANENNIPNLGTSGMAFVTPKKELIGNYSSVIVRGQHLPGFYVKSKIDESKGRLTTLKQVQQQNEIDWEGVEAQLEIPKQDNYLFLVQVITPNTLLH